jgi:hypothetical protein
MHIDPRKLAAEGNISFWGEAMNCGWSASMECSEDRQKGVRQQLSKKPRAGGRQKSPSTYTNGRRERKIERANRNFSVENLSSQVKSSDGDLYCWKAIVNERRYVGDSR